MKKYITESNHMSQKDNERQLNTKGNEKIKEGLIYQRMLKLVDLKL